MWAHAHAQPVTGHAPLRLSDLDLPSASPGAARRGPDESNLKASEPSKGITTGAIRVTFLDTTDDDSTKQHDYAGTTESPNVGHGPHQRIVESIATVGRTTPLAGQELPPTITPETNHYSHAKDPVWPPPRRESLMNRSSTPWKTKQPDTMDTINIAVVGSLGVGKSTFIQRALRLTRLPTSNTATVRQDVEGVPHVVTLVEFDMEYFDLDDVVVPGQPIQWPKQINGQFVPRLEGAFVLYDVTNKESVPEIPVTLSLLANNNLPSMVLATKCDVSENRREVDIASVSRMTASSPLCFAESRTSLDNPSSQRDCLQTMLKAIIASRRGALERSETASRRRAASTAHLDAPPDYLNGRPLSQESLRHSRASSDLSFLRGFPPIGNEGYYRPSSRSPSRPYGTPGQSPDAIEEGQVSSVHGMLRTPGIRLDGTRLELPRDSFLEAEESEDSYRYSDDIPILQRNDDGFADRPAKMMGLTFDELVDRLVAMKMSRADNNYGDIFLCLFRKFAPPGQLFGALRARLERVREDKTTHYLLKTEAQLRIIEVVAKWVSLYPGDFARPATRRSLEELITHLSTEPIFAAAAHQMRLYMNQKIGEDDDTGWANSDEPGNGADDDVGYEYNRKTSQSQRASEMSERAGSLQLEEPTSADPRRPSQGSDVLSLERGGSRASAAPFQFYSYEDYEREAAALVPTYVFPMTKVRYREFMDINPDKLAEEMTRIDWVMFSSIRVRDFVRHVSLTAEQKEKCKSLKNVNRMINHFNHVAKWVANMILIRDKPKHRAPALEKFMNIAAKLRQLNNYNGLAAVLAGISDTAIHRLAQTRALVNPDVQKRFARLQLLMGTQKSHFAYRLAWENSPLPRIPFIPLHRRDLVSAEEGSRTFVGPKGDRINWKKFEVLGEVILPIMKSQGQPYSNLSRHDRCRELILDCNIMTDDEDIYQRSVQVETGMAESSKKKFPWLAN